MRFWRYFSDSLPQGYFFFCLSLQYCLYSGASIPINRIRRLPISRLSPSTAFTGAVMEEVISSALPSVLKNRKSMVKSIKNKMLYGVYMFDNFLPIGGLSIYFYISIYL